MCRTGDIVEIYSATVGYPKYHLCIEPENDSVAAKFLFLNSEGGYEADFVVPDDEVSCLPCSPTGETVISCSQLLRINRRQRRLFNAKVKGQLDKKVAAKLVSHVEQTAVLPAIERRLIVTALRAYCGT
jgi:hypothetical protein